MKTEKKRLAVCQQMTSIDPENKHLKLNPGVIGGTRPGGSAADRGKFQNSLAKYIVKLHAGRLRKNV